MRNLIQHYSKNSVNLARQMLIIITETLLKAELLGAAWL
jgi:hypothetical protein